MHPSATWAAKPHGYWLPSRWPQTKKLLPARREKIQGQPSQRPHAELQAALVHIKARRVVGCGKARILVLGRAAHEVEESRHFLLVAREILGTAQLVDEVHVGIARHALEVGHRPSGERFVVDGDIVTTVDMHAGLGAAALGDERGDLRHEFMDAFALA